MSAWLCAGRLDEDTIFVPATYDPAADGWSFNLMAVHTAQGEISSRVETGHIYTFTTMVPTGAPAQCLGDCPYYGAKEILVVAERVRSLGSLDDMARFYASTALGAFMDDLLVLIPHLPEPQKEALRAVLGASS